MTPRERDAFNVIFSYWRDNGYAPSYREIADKLGLYSTSGVHRLVTSLERKGRVRRVAGLARTVEIAREPAV